MEFLSKTPQFDFIGKWRICAAISILLCLASIYVWISLGETKYGVDFRGGHELIVKVASGTSESVRAALEKGGVQEPLVQSFETGSQQFTVRLGGRSGEGAAGAEEVRTVKESVRSALATAFGGEIEILKADYVGPTVGRELRIKALIATVLGLVMILAYLSFRFEFAFGIGAVIAIFHDVIIATGLYLVAGYTINMGTIAAALTILGYSVHDTIVVFDRVREEIFRRKDFVLSDLMNECINATLSRTIITTFLTLLSVLALLVFGGGSIADLSFFLVVGLICGTYSTVYVAAPVVMLWEHLRHPLADRARASA